MYTRLSDVTILSDMAMCWQWPYNQKFPPLRILSVHTIVIKAYNFIVRWLPGNTFMWQRCQIQNCQFPLLSDCHTAKISRSVTRYCQIQHICRKLKLSYVLCIKVEKFQRKSEYIKDYGAEKGYYNDFNCLFIGK